VIRIVVGHRLFYFRAGIRQVWDQEPDFEIAAEAATGREVLEAVDRHHPDAVLVDMGVRDPGGGEVVRLLTTAATSTRVVALIDKGNDDLLVEAVLAGAHGYLLSDTCERRLSHAIRTAVRGETIVDPALTTSIVRGLRRDRHRAEGGIDRLTPGEMAVLRLVAQGLENSDIASALHLAERTVTNRLSLIYEKLSVNNRTQAALHALRHGWASLWWESGA
jgi:two-component system, NarL family, response regulator LiaR